MAVSKRFITINVAATVIILIAGIILKFTFLRENYNFFYLILLFTALGLNFIIHIINNGSKTSKQKFTSDILISFGVKFFMYILLTILFLAFYKDKFDRILFIGHLFAIYILFSVIEIKYRP